MNIDFSPDEGVCFAPVFLSSPLAYSRRVRSYPVVAECEVPYHVRVRTPDQAEDCETAC